MSDDLTLFDLEKLEAYVKPVDEYGFPLVANLWWKVETDPDWLARLLETVKILIEYNLSGNNHILTAFGYLDQNTLSDFRIKNYKFLEKLITKYKEEKQLIA